MNCPICGQGVRDGARFCGKCGADLQGIQQQPYQNQRQYPGAQQPQGQPQYSGQQQYPNQPQWQGQPQNPGAQQRQSNQPQFSQQQQSAGGPLQQFQVAAQSQGRSLLPQWAYIVADILVIVLVTFMPWFTVSLEGITGSLGVGAASLGGMLSSSCSLAGLGFQLIATLMKIMPYMGMAASLDSSTSSTITTVLIIYVLVTIVVIALWAGCVICSVRAIIADVKRRPGERAAFSGYALASVAALMSIVCMFLIKAILASMIQYVSMEQIPMYTSAGCWISLILCGALAVLRKRYPAAALTSSSPAGITPNSGQR